MNINFLPWREVKRQMRKRAFHQSILLSILAWAVVVIGLMLVIENSKESQLARNAILEKEIVKINARIQEINLLDEKIKTLQARQEAIAKLQFTRSLSIKLLDELVDIVPVGVILKSIKQADMITLTGYAQSNARISELMRNIDTQSHSLAKAKLVESKLASYGQGKELRKLFEFTMTATALTEGGE